VDYTVGLDLLKTGQSGQGNAVGEEFLIRHFSSSVPLWRALQVLELHF
jgi:hypothetical protein